MTQFATALELSQYLTGTPDEESELADAFVVQANLFLSLIGDDIEAIVGTSVSGATGTDLIPGTWSRDLPLQRSPIREIASVLVNGIALSSAEYLWNERGLLRRGAGALSDLDEFDFPEDWNSFGQQGATWRAGGHWGGPASTIRITYTYGPVEPHPFLRSLTLRTAARVIGNPGQLTQESLGPYSASYAGAADTDGTHLRPADVKRLRKLFSVTAGTISSRGR